jgi:REP element-mobilizing transposase RayT
MPRQARLDIPGVLQHVMARGIERGAIFRDDTDRQRFVARFSTLLVETHTPCLAWALVPNHFHLLLRPTETSLASFMRRLMTGYAVSFNIRHGRSGHVFQNRYKSFVCEEEEYLLALVRYIGLNPLRSGQVATVEELDRYPWASHAVLMGNRSLEGQATEEVLARFGRRRREAIGAYRAFVDAGVALGKQPELVGGGLLRSLQGQEERAEEHGTDGSRQAYDARVLGSGPFVEAVWQKEGVPKEDGPPVPLSELAARVARAYGVEAADILRRRRRPELSEARALMCYVAVRHMGYKGVAVARFLGMTRAGSSSAVQRGAETARCRPEEVLQALRGREPS